MNKSFSLHKITNAEQFSFDAADYSRFKYGDNTVAAIFGKALAEGFIKEYENSLLDAQQLVIISSPYSFIPTATFAMKNYFVFTLNRWLAENNLPITQETKVHRTITYKDDYGALDAAERLALIGNDSFHIDAEFLTNKTLVFLDDIRITGSHEKMITKMLGEYNLANDCYLLYFAELVNKDIHPNIENHLNYFSVKSISDLNDIVQSNNFIINTRIVKYILHTESKMFLEFIEKQSFNFINLLFDMAIGNGYHTIEAYSGNMEILKELILKKH